MPYPSKTDRAAILAAAVDQLAREGLRGVSVRSVAASLGLAPNAIYRYFADRSALEAAMSAESTRRLHQTLVKAAGGKARSPDQALRRMAAAYLGYAREHRHLYDMMMTKCRNTPEDAAVHTELWTVVVEQVALLSGRRRAREAAVALWAFLHGTAALDAAEVFGEEKPFSAFRFGLEAWIAAALRTRPAVPTRRESRPKVRLTRCPQSR